jgi:hypothetical protein
VSFVKCRNLWLLLMFTIAGSNMAIELHQAGPSKCRLDELKWNEKEKTKNGEKWNVRRRQPFQPRQPHPQSETR